MKKLLVLYKTHLDVGFTDFSKNIVELYLKNYIPNAIDTAMSINESGEKKFIWQTGSWILREYLNSVSGEELKRAEYAIDHDYIAWHGMPFTAHTELFTSELLEYGLDISRELDERYGKRTVAAKSTDVPGMTKAMIKPLAEAGIRFVHLGVNSASPVPDVPPMFRWRAESGEELLVMYDQHYGGFNRISEDCAVTFQFAGDNLAPMTKEMVAESFAQLQAEYPDTLVIPATLNDVAAEVEKIRHTLPVLECEIGDSWIHGLMTDPRKVFSYQAALRFAKTAEPEARRRLYDGLLLIPEHTWGLDEKTHLADRVAFEKQTFHAALSKPNFQKMEQSWQEQRDYVFSTVRDVASETLDAALAEYKRERIAVKHDALASNPFAVNAYGEIVGLEIDGRVIADEAHPLCSFLYEVFSEQEYERFLSRYNRRRRQGEDALEWMLEDFSKIGMASGNDVYRSYRPQCVNVAYDGEQLAVDCEMPKEACERFGCPRSIQYTARLQGNRLILDFAWFDKDKNRVAEAMWLKFKPAVDDPRAWRIEKLGQMINPFIHAPLGGVQHYTNGVVQNQDVAIRMKDGALVSFGEENLLAFDHSKQDGSMVSVNLYNNQWGTNFPMWYDEDGRIRIEIEILG